MPRVNFQINGASVIIAIVAVVLGIAFIQKSCDEQESNLQNEVLSGKLTDAQIKLTSYDKNLRIATSTVKSLTDLNRLHTNQIKTLSQKLGSVDVVRSSNAGFSIKHTESGASGEVTVAKHKSGAVPWSFENSWLWIGTTNALDKSALVTWSVEMQATLSVIGIRERNGILENESVDLELQDKDGHALPFQPELSSYHLDYVPNLQPEPRWYEKCDLRASIYGGAHTTYPLNLAQSGLMVGADVGIYGAFLGIEADIGIREVPIMGIIRAGYRFEFLD